MTTALTEADAFTASVLVPNDGDDLAATTFNLAPQALANRTRWLLNRLPVAYHALNSTVYTIGSSDPDQLLNRIVVPMLTGETLLIASSAGFWGAALTSVQGFAYLNVNGVRLTEQWASHVSTHAVVDGISGGMLPFALTGAYVAVADGNVTVDHELGITIGTGDTRHPSTLNILRVRA